MRYVTPLIFFAVAAYVWQGAEADPHRVMVFPLLDRLDPTLRNDPVRWAHWSALLFAAIGGLFFVRALVRSLREGGHPPPANKAWCPCPTCKPAVVRDFGARAPVRTRRCAWLS